MSLPPTACPADPIRESAPQAAAHDPTSTPVFVSIASDSGVDRFSSKEPLSESCQAPLRLAAILRRTTQRLSLWHRKSSWGAVGRWLGMEDDSDDGVDVFGFLKSRVSGDGMEMVAAKSLLKGKMLPLFVFVHCALCLISWLVSAWRLSADDGADFASVTGGLDYVWPLWTDLRFWGRDCQDFRWQPWRWFTYQFTHDGLAHVLVNCFLLLALGIPIEGMHGHLRMMYLFNVGVFGGACCSMVLDPHTAVVGSSGGCYSLIGVHLADLMLNWSQKKFRIPTLLLVVILIFIGLLGAWTPLSSAGTSHTAHLGGAIAGLCAGLTIVRNIKVEHCERYIIGAAWVVGFALTVFCVAWLFLQDGGPHSFGEAMAGEQGWCWYAQAIDSSRSPPQWQCVRCGTVDCVREFYEFNATESSKFGEPALTTVSLASCIERGWHYDGR
eukprot:CAMPEP_0176019460 /NCGR_PEP_ID=MMETSP0120_2-20121206/9402_1 /TAXON_ID=160619 /ORGANISM="Kryptoperidinium foliaceum, Strain CCMP 1326" /LENGTH=439 /DNA_ID=CAMNT_0017352537 /DNA_START=36 /DNA_END=1355 /DNA_ORIENTATION=-